MIDKDQVIPVGNNTMQANLRSKINGFFDWSIHRMGRRMNTSHRETTLSVQLLALKQNMNQLKKENTFSTKIASSCIQFCLNILKGQIHFLPKD